MKILSSEIAMASGHSYLQKYEKSERLRTWVDSPDRAFPPSQLETDHGRPGYPAEGWVVRLNPNRYKTISKFEP